MILAHVITTHFILYPKWHISTVKQISTPVSCDNCISRSLYRDEIYSLQILLSRTQAGPGRTVTQEQEEISPNNVQRIDLISVLWVVCCFTRSQIVEFRYSDNHIFWHCTVGQWEMCHKLLISNLAQYDLTLNVFKYSRHWIWPNIQSLQCRHRFTQH